MQRRNLIRFTLAGAATGALMPRILAASPAHNDAPLAGSVFYTKEAPGRWSGKEATHLPRIEIEKKSDGVSVKIVTGHEISGFKHYIVKHILLDKDHKFIGEKMFDPSKETTVVSTFSLDGAYSGPIHALSVCNKHDTWLSSAEV